MNKPPEQPNTNTDGLMNKNAREQQQPTPINDLTPSTTSANTASPVPPAQAGTEASPVSEHNPQDRPTSALPENNTIAAPRNAAAGAAGTTTAPASRPRFSRRRIVIWLIELVVLLAATEHFILKPRLARNRAEKAQAAQTAKLEQEVQEVIRPLAERARVLPSLSEVFPAYLAPLTGLADGSKNMRDTQLSVSEQEGLPVEVVNSIGMAFRLVPAGTGLIGSPPDEPGRGSIEMQHVMIFPHHFYMGKYEVTQAQWRLVMGEKNNPSHYFGDSRPVEEVSWYDALRFTNALCEREGLPLGTYRLPSETEWEYACRAGTSTAYCFGNNPKDLDLWADYADNNYQSTRSVGQRRPNALGLYDMHGNVWEWCLNKYTNYPGDETPEAEYHQWPTIRGGNWHVAAPECRSANRCRLPGASVGNMLGFRIIRTITASIATSRNSPTENHATKDNTTTPENNATTPAEP
ncbi:MAG: formylglycine-generating enzyme family protein [Lentisphaeria bacterium]|nr:formylglycine-generating enzyme family protein [Lentisphaeria bacterium]